MFRALTVWNMCRRVVRHGWHLSAHIVVHHVGSRSWRWHARHTLVGDVTHRDHAWLLREKLGLRMTIGREAIRASSIRRTLVLRIS